MLPEALTALAVTGGAAVVQAAGTDTWEGLRDRLARLLGRGEGDRVRRETERLDQVPAALEASAPGERERVRMRCEGAWQVRFETLLESLPEPEREVTATLLRTAVEEAARHAVRAGDHGVSVAGDLRVRADNGSLAGGVVDIDGAVTLTGNPPVPGADEA